MNLHSPLNREAIELMIRLNDRRLARVQAQRQQLQQEIAEGTRAGRSTMHLRKRLEESGETLYQLEGNAVRLRLKLEQM